MLHLVTALHAEAAPIISRYKLRRDLSARSREIFRGDGIDLIVSGIGKVRSAMAVTRLLHSCAESKADLIVNIGICGARETIPIGTLLWVNQVTDNGSKRRFYPDAILKHGLPEAPLLTCDRPVAGTEEGEGCGLFDMEGSGFFEAAGALLAPHQICCMKVVSDHLSPGTVTPELASGLISDRLDEFERVLFLYRAYLESSGSGLTPETLLRLHEIGRSLRFTAAQQRILGEDARAYILRGGDPAILNELPHAEVTSRRQSKEIFEKIRNVLAAP